MGSNFERMLDQLDIELDNRTAYHEWTRIANGMAHDFADALEAGAEDLLKRLRKTPVAESGYIGAPGRRVAARKVTSGIRRASQEARAIPVLLSKSFYTFNGLYVPATILKSGGALDPTV